MKIKSIRQIKNLGGKTVLLRTDFNVPINKGKVLDDYKIIANLPTIRHLMRHRSKIIMASHLGDPGGKINKELSLKPVAGYLSKLLGREVVLLKNYVEHRAGEAAGLPANQELVLLENLRFNKGETADDKQFAKALGALADIYVNNAFAVCHRKHASVSAIKKFLPAYAGLLLEEEINNLHKALKPKRPLVVIMGGAKISTKIPLISNFLKRADQLLVGGAIANDFLKGQGYEVGKSLVTNDLAVRVKVDRIYRQAGNQKIILPLDVIVSGKKDGSDPVVLRGISSVKKNEYILDIGPRTIGFFAQYIRRAGTLVWNGPLGLFENEKFKHGTLATARLLAARAGGKAFGVVGGGETIEALKKTKMIEYVDWVSTGGGAMLAYLGGEDMPGLKGLVK